MTTPIKVLAYARVSTTEQAEKELSIPAQLKEIQAYAKSKGMIVAKEYTDEGVSAYRETKRINFEAMIEYAKNDKEIKHILVHDASRFSRNRRISSQVKGELQQYGITVISVSNPYDPTTISGTFLDSIDDTIAQTTSMVIGMHVVKGMKENAAKRDPETGYCYKNGGRIPYGYRAKPVNPGKEQRKDNYKLLWENDPETAPILRMIIVDWRIGEGLSYKQIRDRLNERNILNPNGKLWISSSISQMFREDRLMQYAGYYYWNRAEKRGMKRETLKDKSEWIIVENAHPAIISKEAVEAALALAKSRRPRTAAVSSYNSPWALTGLNLEGDPFFTCKVCGGNMSGLNDPRGGKYACSNYHYRGKIACANKHTVRRPVIESQLLRQIEEYFASPESIDSLVKEINSRLNGELNEYHKSINHLKNEVKKVKDQIELTFKAYEEGLDPDLCNERFNKLKSKRLELEQQLEKLEKEQPQPLLIDAQKARQMFYNLKEIYENGSNEQKRNLFKTYIRRMEFDPETNQVNVVFYAPYVQEKLRTGGYSKTYTADHVGNTHNVICNATELPRVHARIYRKKVL